MTGDATAGDGSAKGGGVMGTLKAGEGFGEMSLLKRRPAHTKTVACNSSRCEVVEILGDDFMRLVEKSRVVRESFEKLESKRSAQNEKRQSGSA